MEVGSHRFRLSKIHIRNYKSIDDLEVSFPPPRSPEQPDVFVLGSKNGVGKTSFLECCAWTLLAAKHKLTERLEGHAPFATVVRSGKDKALVVANGLVEGHDRQATLHIHPSGFNVEAAHGWRERGTLSAAEDWYTRLLGAESEPLVLPPVLFFHSYRKVNEGSSALGDIVAPEFSYTRARYGRFGPTALSTFKFAVVRALMAQSGLFELAQRGRHETANLDQNLDSGEVLSQLNSLIEAFAGGRVEKLRPGREGNLELRVLPTDGGDSFSFDGLSSGQKEIIATLFLIWHHTRNQPSVVLIDEPELHLNAEWQRIFVHQLNKIAPQNQYILATHAEEIWASVDEDRRIMLSPGSP